MKKTFIPGVIENEYLYYGIPELYGEFLVTSCGDPLTLSTLEDTGCEEEIANIKAIIENPLTGWEDCNESDVEYVQGWLSDWGII